MAASIRRTTPRVLQTFLTQRLLVFRLLILLCQTATIVITWPLWQMHVSPPMLPALPLPAFDLGLLLLASLALLLVRPAAGITLHTILLIYAMLIDQTRIQPEIISLALLLWGTLPNPGAQLVARAHLIAMWAWAGINKLLSPNFLRSTGPSMFNTLFHGAPAFITSNSGYLIALTEVATGLCALFPRTRKFAALLAFGLHIGILLTLIAQRWNQSVWPWNIGAALAGFALIWPWKTSLWTSLKATRRAVAALVVVILLSPALWFVGITDTYLSYHLYSSDVPTASSTALDPGLTWQVFKVPLPPEQRLFEQYFRLTCAAGDTMTIYDQRAWFQAQGLGTRTLECAEAPNGSP